MSQFIDQDNETRSFRLAWKWVRTLREHSTSMRQVVVLRPLEKWRWQYVLYQKGTYLIQADEGQPWRKFQAVIEKPGQWVWLGQQQLTEEHANPVN